MVSEERTWLLAHLKDQAATLASMAGAAVESAGTERDLVAFRDQVFVIKETLGTLGVPGALLSRDDWSDLTADADEEPGSRGAGASETTRAVGVMPVGGGHGRWPAR